jgi:hypothetical protein
MAHFSHRAGVGIGTDTGGFASLPGPPPDTYGLLADLVADTRQTSTRRAPPVLFRWAEAHLGTWQRAVRHH